LLKPLAIALDRDRMTGGDVPRDEHQESTILLPDPYMNMYPLHLEKAQAARRKGILSGWLICSPRLCRLRTYFQILAFIQACHLHLIADTGTNIQKGLHRQFS
jgi:hypothetical protein